MDTSTLRKEYERKVKDFEQLSKVANFVLRGEIEKKKIEVYSIPTRIKTFDSLLKKAQDKEIKDPFTEIRDIVGLRVICLFLDDVQKIADIVKKSFAVIKKENINDTGKDVFRYSLLQFKVKLKDTSTPNPEDGHIKDIPFEIQVRTIAQDAWASISHHLDYKSPTGKPIPKHIKRDFFALNGLFYVADTHFAMIRKEQYKPLERSLKKS